MKKGGREIETQGGANLVEKSNIGVESLEDTCFVGYLSDSRVLHSLPILRQFFSSAPFTRITKKHESGPISRFKSSFSRRVDFFIVHLPLCFGTQIKVSLIRTSRYSRMFIQFQTSLRSIWLELRALKGFLVFKTIFKIFLARRKLINYLSFDSMSIVIISISIVIISTSIAIIFTSIAIICTWKNVIRVPRFTDVNYWFLADNYCAYFLFSCRVVYVQHRR